LHEFPEGRHADYLSRHSEVVAEKLKSSLDAVPNSEASSQEEASAAPKGSLRARVVSGLSWTAASQALGQVLQLGIAAVLARLLSPNEYGLLGMVLVFTGFATNFADLSLGASIIQKKDITERHLNSVFWLNIAVGAALTLLFTLAAPLVAAFYGEPTLRLLTIGVAASFVLNSLAGVQSALLDKSLNFRAKFWINLTTPPSCGAAPPGDHGLVLTFPPSRN
jgi:PST family polysaccharide transporter